MSDVRQSAQRLQRIGRLVCGLLLVFSVFPIFPALAGAPKALGPPPAHQDMPAPQESTVTGVVLEIREKPVQRDAPRQGVLATDEYVQLVTVRIASGELQGRTVTVENVQGSNPIYNIPLQEGARVLLYVEKTPDGRHQVYISNRDRMPALMILFGAFLLALLLVGGKPTFKYVALGGFGALLVARSVTPPMLTGEPGSLMAMVWILLMGLVGGILFLPEGRQGAKMLLLLILALLANATLLLLVMFVVSVLAPLQGFFSESMASLWYQYPRLDFQQMLYATAVISHGGLLLVVTLGVLRACLKAAESPMTRARGLFAAGMRQGQQWLGPILLGAGMLYLGLYLPNLLQGTGGSVLDALNLEVYATYAAIILSGALAVVLAVPVTAGLCAWLLRGRLP